jgi:hypothetical protein
VAVNVQIEAGAKKTFAIAIDWPGWARSGPDADAALETLLTYSARYKRSMGASVKALTVPKTVRGLTVVATVKGDAGTDYGVPSKDVPGADDPVSAAELKRLLAIVQASWRAFGRAADKASGVALAKGPRGGGRTLAKMREHYLQPSTPTSAPSAARHPTASTRRRSEPRCSTR